MRGRLAMHAFGSRLVVDLPAFEPEGTAIARMWARQKISTLGRATHWQGETLELTGAIRSLALEHRLMSKFTSFIAVDSAPPSAGPGESRLITQPSELPEGIDLPTSRRSFQSAGSVAQGTEAEDPAMHVKRVEESMVRRRGCATCAVGSSGGSGGQTSFLFVAGLLAVLLLRRRIFRQGTSW